jgi:DNA-binding LacI/PurR family transcriptional regulator
MSEDMEVLPAAPRQPYWAPDDPDTCEDRVERLARHGIAPVKRLFAGAVRDVPRGSRFGWLTQEQRELVADSALLAPLVRDQGVTAILAGNDGVAVRLHRWFRFAGLRVPRDVSLLSFDNSSAIAGLPISSMDLGLGSLGYRAFHLILGDLGIRANRRGDLIGEPAVNHGLSVGPVRKGALSVDLSGEV